MPTVHSQTAGLASSTSGRWLAWSEAGRLRVLDLSRPGQAAELAVKLESPFEIAVSSTEPERLIVLQAKGGSTVLRMFALPELREIVEARLTVKGESHLVALTGSVAVLLGGTEALTAVDLVKLRASPLAVRGPIQVVTQLSGDQVLVGSRGKLEAWSLEERRPTHRLGLPLAGDAAFGGVIANGKLLWIAAASGAIALFRLSDGKLLTTTAAGGAIKAIIGDPASSTVVAVVESGQLLALDLETQARRVLPFDQPIVAFCLAGAPPDAIAILAEDGQPVLLPLGTGTAAAAPRPVMTEPTVDDAVVEPSRDAETVKLAAPPVLTNDLHDRLSQWRAQVQAVVIAAPRKPTPLSDRVARAVLDEPRSRSRAELYAWGHSARVRTTTSPPPPPQLGRIADLATRFKLDMRSRSLLALLYASWLDGEGRTGVAVGVLARALGNDEEAWVEALAQGRLGRIGWISTGYGRTRLRGMIGRFLDEAPPRVTLVAAGEDAVASLVPPTAPSRVDLSGGAGLVDAAKFVDRARDIANLLGDTVAAIDASDLPAARVEALLAEARLHGALPIIVPPAAPAAGFELRMLEGAALVAGAGDDPRWQGLPVWPAVAVGEPEPAPVAVVAE